MMKKYYILILILILSVCSNDPSRLKRKKHTREKPSDYVENHFYEKKLEGKFNSVRLGWFGDTGTIRSEDFYNSAINVSLFFYRNGIIDQIWKSIQVAADPHYTHYDKEASLYIWQSSGKQLEYYESGKLKTVSCKVALDYVPSEKCGEEIHYKEDGSIEKKINHPRKCTQGCDLMIPYREPGKYIVMKDDVKVWDTSIIYGENEDPKKELKSYIKSITPPVKVLKKGDIVTVTKDLEIFDREPNDEMEAPWVKIRLGLFSEGVVSSGSLDGPFE